MQQIKSSLRLWMIGALLALFSSASQALVVWDSVYAAGPTQVRQTASSSSTLIAEKPTDSKGVITGGPTASEGYTWWLLLWEDGVSGFSRETTLAYYPPVPTIFADKIGLGWRENGWANTTSNFTSTVKRYGTYGIQTTTSAAWARQYIRTNGFNTSGYHSLRFSVRSENAVGQLYVALYSTGEIPFHYVPVNAYVEGGVINPNTWYDVRVLLSGVNELDAANKIVGGFVVESAVAGTFHLDDIAIDTVIGSTKWIPPAPPPPPPPVSQAGAILYGEEAGWGWDVGSWTNTFINPASPLAYTGSKGIEVRTTAPWARLQLVAEPSFKFNTGGYDTLSFFINMGKREGADLHVGLLNANREVINNDYAALVDYVALAEHEWRYVRIPLSHLSAVNTDVYGVEIQSSNSGTFHVDVVRFETNGGCQP